MRAAIYNGMKNIQLVELPTPQAKENDIVVKNLYEAFAEQMSRYIATGPARDIRSTWAVSLGMKWFRKLFKLGKM